MIGHFVEPQPPASLAMGGSSPPRTKGAKGHCPGDNFDTAKFDTGSVAAGSVVTSGLPIPGGEETWR